MSLDSFLLRLKRGDTPLFRSLKQVYRWMNNAYIPVPRAAKPLGRLLYSLQFLGWVFGKRMLTLLVREPLFRCRCESVGKRLSLSLLPEVTGHTTIHIGDDVSTHGKFGVYTGRVFDRAVLTIGDRVSIGHLLTITCNREVTIEDDVYIAGNCAISDNDGHPLDMQLRITGHPAPPEKTKPVRICRGAWIGAGSFILKGVTVGEGGVVGANSVVTSDVPPFTVVAGNPARIVRHLQPVQTTPPARHY